ncbi:MAG: hypothetical protein E6819_09315, partial [Staphylococcus epidermidis]|nr:hypothetical protein [Staphylococcus epidermidis]
MKKFFILLLSSLLVLTACGKNYEISDIINKFKNEGLSVENLRKMEREDFGMAPMKTENAKIFTVSDGKNARILKFKNEDDLKEMKKYYEELGKSSAAFYSHVYIKDKFLIQMNGD